MKDYEIACKNGTVTSDDFTRIMGKASTQAQEYSKNIKEGTGSAQIYADKQKTLQQSIQNTGTASMVAAVGVKALSIAGNMLAGMAIAFAISKVIEGINYLTTASERAIEKTKELQQEISQISSDYQSERQTLEGLREEYDTLTSKIGENGAEASLSADEYERYRDITSEILGITPKLITGWDEEGRAISNKNGLLQQSIDLLDEEYQKSLRNSTTKSKNEEIAAGIIEQKEDFDNSGDTKTVSGTKYDLVWKDLEEYINKAVADKKISYTYESTGIVGTDDTDVAYAINEFVYGDNLYKDVERDSSESWLHALQGRITSSQENFEKFANSLSNEDNPIYQWFTDEQIDELISGADEYFQELARIKDEEQQYYQQYKDQLNLNAQAVGDAYSDLDEETKAGIIQMIDSFDYSDMTKEKFSDMAIDLKDFISKLSADDTLLSYFNNMFKPIDEDESIEDYETRVKTGIDEISSYCEKNYPAIKLSFGDVEKDVEDLKLKYNTAISKFTGDANDVDLTKFFEDNFINDESEIDYWNRVTEGAKSAEEAVRMYNEAKSQNDNDLSDSFADIFNSADFSEVKAELLELAKSGELTTATLTSTEEYNNLLSKTGLLAGDAKDKILDMLSAQDKLSAASQGLDNLKSAYEEFKDEEIGFVTAETLSSLPDAFKELKGFDLFSQIVGDPMSGTKKIQQAFDDIAKEYLVEQRTLTGLSRENMNSYIANIKQMGITNAEEVVNTVLTNLESTNTMIEQAEKEYIQCLNDGTAADLDHVQTVMAYNQKLASELGTSYQKDYETWCELLKLKSEAYNEFVERIGGSYNSELSTIQNMMNNGKNMSASNIADALAAEAKVRDAEYQVQKQSEILKIDMTPIDTNFGGGYSPKTGDDSKKDKKDEFSQTFNWVETLLDKLSKKTEELKEKFEEAFSLTKAKTAFKKAIDQITKEIKQNEKAVEYYEKKANGVKLSSKYKKLVDSGALKIEDITDEALAKRIELYQDYKDKAEACRDTIDDLRDSYAELADTFYSKPLEVRDNNIEEFTTQLELLDSKIENATSAKERENYAKQKESLYKKEYKSYVTAEETTAKYLKSAKSNINQKSDKALKGLTDKQKATITNAVKNGVEITDAIIDMDSLTPEALKAIENYNSALKNNKQAASDAAQAEQDLAQNIRENKQVKIDSKQDEIDNLKAQYENLDENNWQGRNDNLDEQIKKTKTLYKLLIDQETDVVRKEQLRAELNKEIADLTEQQVNNIRTYWQNVGNLEGSIADERNSKQDYLEASSKDTVASRVENYNTTAFQSRKEAVAKLNEANTYDPNKADYHSAMSEYWSLMAQASEAEYSVWKESVLGVYDSVIDEVTKKGDDLEKAIELDEAKGIEKDEYDYIALINQASAEIAVNQNKIEQLQQKQQQIIAEGGSIESTAYKDLQAQIEKCEGAIYDNQKAQIEYNNALDNLPLERLEKALELLESIGDRYGSENDLKLKLGFKLTEEDFQNELDNIDKQVANLDGQINEKWTDYLKAEAEGNMSKAEGLLKEYNGLVAQRYEILSEKEDVKDEKRDYLYIKPLEDRLAKLEHKSDMLSGIGDLIPDDMKFDSDGNLTDLGRTAIAIDVSQLGNAREQLKAIGEEISVVQELYEKGEYTLDERNEKMNDLQNQALDIAKSQMDSMNSLKDMATSMAENELDALNKIIEKRRKALQAKKSYYDYDKNLRNQNKQISALEAEIAAMQNVDDAYTKSLLARKQAELDELKEARDDTIIEHNYEIQSNGLDELQEDLQTKYDEYIDGIGENFESIEKIVGNAKGMFANSFNAISDNMYKLLQSYGIDPNTTGIAWTKITDTEGFATGGIIRSNYTGQDDRILVRVNPDETILTKKFTDLLPDAVQAMNNFNMLQPTIPQPIIPNFKGNTGTSTTNID